MFPADPLIQIYMVTTVVGWGFILVSILMGQIGDHDGQCEDGAHHFHGLHDTQGHDHIHHLDGQTTGMGHLNHNPGATGALHTVGDHQPSAPHSPHGNGSHSDTGHSHHDGHDGETKDTSSQPVVDTANSNTQIQKIYFTLLSILSPFTLSYFAGFFGLTGSILAFLFPWLSWVSLVPATIAGVAGVQVVRGVTGLLAQKLSVSSTVSIDQSIGQLAEVSTPITDGRVGEITYKIGKNRFNAAAKPFDASKTFKRGSKVVIVQSEGPIMLVQAFDEED